MSRKSQNETNYEEMDIEDIDARIQETEGLLKKQEKEFLQVQKQNKNATQQARATKLQPIEDAINFLRQRIIFFLQLKDAKIQPYEKLPKDHQFYLHIEQFYEYNKIRETTIREKNECNSNFEQAIVHMKVDQERAKRMSLGQAGINKKIVPYE